jgi:hypothetical protein
MSREASDHVWAQLVDELAAIARIDTGQVHRHSLLVDDLGLDSLALAEVAVAIERGHGRDVVGAAERLDWGTATAGDLLGFATAG